MKDKFEQRLFQMAGQEKIVVPEPLDQKIDDILVSLPKQHRVFRMTWKKSVVLAAALTAMFSLTVTAAVKVWQQRMEAMNEQEMEEYFLQLYTGKIGVDNYNRPYMDTEKTRMKELRTSYENGEFPDGLLTMIEMPEEYKGKGVAFYAETTTFFFPDKEMSDEELLQIIDFMYKRDYSIQAVNEKIAAGEMAFPEEKIEKILEEREKEVEKTKESVLQSDAVYDPAQELTIPYTGDLEIRNMAMGQNCLFLTGRNAIHTMEIGSSDSTLFFDGFEVKTDVSALYQDKKGDIYLALMEWTDGEDYVATMAGEKYKNSLWILSKEGNVKKKIDLSPYKDEFGVVNRMVVDDEGYIYLRGMWMKDILMVLDKDGNYVKNITSDLECAFMPHSSAGLGIGKDGRVYTVVEAGGDSTQDLSMGIAAVNLEKGVIEDVHLGIVPKGTIMLDIIAPGADTDFVLWGYDGIFTYNMGEESAVNILPAYEAPCSWEGCKSCALPDGRIVFLDCTEYREDGQSAHRIPEKTCFYYKSGLRSGG